MPSACPAALAVLTIMARSATYAVVHVNAEFAQQAPDHDPSVMRVAHALCPYGADGSAAISVQ